MAPVIVWWPLRPRRGLMRPFNYLHHGIYLGDGTVVRYVGEKLLGRARLA